MCCTNPHARRIDRPACPTTSDPATWLVGRAFNVTLLTTALLLVAAAATGQDIEQGNLVVELNRLIDRPPFSELALPLMIDTPGDGSGRLFMPEKQGRIRFFEDGTLSTFLDIRDDTLNDGERGLLAIAFHPDYTDAQRPGFGKIYTYHSTADTAPIPDFDSPATVSHHNVVTEWQVDSQDPNVVDMSTRREIFREAHLGPIHNAGMLEFGPDGYLYASIGSPSGFAQIEAQATSSVLGSILRIDPLAPSLTPQSSDLPSANGQYRIPVTNPFADDAAAVGEIFAYGVRNPYRFSIDGVSGVLLAADVGSSRREEVSAVRGGDNLGWPYREGSIAGPVAMPVPAPTLRDPLVDYSHADGLAITGGFVYRGAIPELQGKYIFGDFQSTRGTLGSLPGRLFWIDPFDESDQLKDSSEIEIHEFRFGPDTCSGLLSDCRFDITVYGFGIDHQGEVYVLGTRGSRAVVYSFESAWYLADADFDQDADVDGNDFLIWQAGFGIPTGATRDQGDADRDGDVDGNDFLIWQQEFSTGGGQSGAGNSPPDRQAAIPEPGSAATALTVLITTVWLPRRRTGRGWPRIAAADQEPVPKRQ